MTTERPALDRPLPAAPSVHVRAILTWLPIFPLVAIGMSVMAPVTEGWPAPVRALVLTIVVVPLAVYLVVPWLVRAFLAIRRALAARASR